MRLSAPGPAVSSFAIAATLIAAAKAGTPPTAVAANVTATIAANVMTVTALAAGSGPLLLGQPVSGTGLVGAYIAAFLTGTGGLGTYTLAGTTVTDGTGIAVTGAAPPFVRTIGTKPAGTTPVFIDCAQVPTTPNAAGKVPPRAGKILLVPCNRNNVNLLEFLDLATGAIENGPVYNDAAANTGRKFACKVRLTNGNILLIPWQAAYFWEYDIYADQVIQHEAHGRPSTGVVPAFSGAGMAKDGLIYLNVGPAADRRVCIYNPITHKLDATTGPVLNLSTDYATVNNGGPVKPLPNGDVMFASVKNGGTTKQNRYAPSTGVLTEFGNAGYSHPTLNLTADGRYVFPSMGTNSQFIINLDTNAVSTFLTWGSAVSLTRFANGIPLTNGKLAMIPNGQNQLSIFDTDLFTSTDVLDMSTIAGWSTSGSAAWANIIVAEHLADGRIFCLPGANLAGFPIITLFSTGAQMPIGVRHSRYFSVR